jgi:Spy/CpxP family protein refolding chaperone
MARLTTMKSVIAAGVLGALALATLPTAFAQMNAQPTPPDHGSSMMNHGMPNDQDGMMPGMMGSANSKEMRQKMTRMMDNCNRMMEGMMQNKPGTPTSPNKG